MRIKMGMMALAFTAMGYGCGDDDDAAGDAFGANCIEGEASCASGLCYPDAVQPYCTEECTAGSCSTGFECAETGTAVCVRTAVGAGGAGGEGGGEGGEGGGAGGEGGGAGGEGGGAGGEGGGAGGEGGGEGGMGGGGNMGLDCAGINDCLQTCGEGDMACVNGCIESGTPTAQDEFLAIIDCIQANGGDQELCQDEIQQCLGAPAGGDGECTDFYECNADCPDDDEGACQQACFNGLTAEAQNQVIEVSNCVGEARDANPDATDEEFNDLIYDVCAEEILACGFDAPAPPGEDSCGEVLACINMNPEGGQACFDEGTDAARDLIIELQTCVVDSECADFSCPACQAEIDACNDAVNPEPEAPEPEAPEPEAPEPDAPEPDAPEPDAPEPDAPEPEANPEPMPDPEPEN